MYEEYILTLLQLPKVGRRTVSKNLSYTAYIPTTAEGIIEVLEKSKLYMKKLRIPEPREVYKAVEGAYRIQRQCKEKGIKIITILNKDFPEKLRAIKDPPVLLFYKGNFECIKEDKAVAIIGSRMTTEHGRKVAEKLGYIFGKEGFVIVTGLALGCDEYAHIGCLKAKGKNAAVLPFSLDNIYPPQNKKLAQEILNNDGCLISEYPLGTEPFKGNFIERDRLQSALSKVVIVVETKKDGGTMHTANFAVEQNKKLYCYVHPQKYLQSPQTEGNRELLLYKKAFPLRNEEDIEDIKKLIIDSNIQPKKTDILKKVEQISIKF